MKQLGRIDIRNDIETKYHKIKHQYLDCQNFLYALYFLNIVVVDILRLYHFLLKIKHFHSHNPKLHQRLLAVLKCTL